MIHDRIPPRDIDPLTEEDLDDYYSELGLFSLVRPTDFFELNTDSTQDFHTIRTGNNPNKKEKEHEHITIEGK